MIFFIIRPFKYKEKTYSRSDKYIEMSYEEAKPFIRRRKLKLSGSQDKKGFKKNKISIVKTTKTIKKSKRKSKQDEVKDDKEISKKSGSDSSKRAVSVNPGKRTSRPLK